MLTDPTFLLALGAAVLAAASLILHVVAPRTKTTVDDKIVGAIDEILAFVRRQIGPGAALALVVLGLGAAAQPACTPIGTEATAAGHAIVDCVHADQAPIEALLIQLASDAIQLALHSGAVDWDALEATAEVRGAQVGGCAYAELVHGRPPASSPTAVHALIGAPPRPDPALVALERLRAKSGGVRWSTSGGVI